MSNFKFLHLVRPFLPILPEIEAPKSAVTFKERCIYTMIVLFVFLVLAQLPLYGITSALGADPLMWMRVIMASNRGTCMELGISPIITSGMVIQLLTGSKLIEVDMSLDEDKKLLKGTEKLIGIIITFGQAIAYVCSGMYGSLSDLGFINASLIVLQLLFAGIIVLCLDELLSKGYGIGSGISLFMATNTCETIIWKSFSPYTQNQGAGPEFEGAFIHAVQVMVQKKDKLKALKNAFFRPGMPNLMNLCATVVVFSVVIYFQGFKVELPVASKQRRDQQGTFPIKLFYTSSMPIILQSALVSNIFFLSQLLAKRYGKAFFVRLLGAWKEKPNGAFEPVGGLVYYITAPRGLTGMIAAPLHTLIYMTWVIGVCALFSKTWIEISGSSPEDVAQQFKHQKMYIKGHRETHSSTLKVLKKYIPTAAALGGVCIGLLTIFADVTGAIGSGTGILLAVGTIYQYYETFKKEADSNKQGF